jgi:hypothetical protein
MWFVPICVFLLYLKENVYTFLLHLFLNRTIRNTQIIHKDPVRTSQETDYISVTKTNRLNLFRETVAVYCENHTDDTTYNLRSVDEIGNF